MIRRWDGDSIVGTLDLKDAERGDFKCVSEKAHSELISNNINTFKSERAQWAMD